MDRSINRCLRLIDSYQIYSHYFHYVDLKKVHDKGCVKAQSRFEYTKSVGYSKRIILLALAFINYFFQNDNGQI